MSDTTWTNEVFIIDGSGVEQLSVTWPNDDKIQHDILNLRCVCVPDYKLTIGSHGTTGCLCMLSEVIHHSLDGRELSE